MVTKQKARYEFGTHSGYDAMSAGYVIYHGGHEIATIDVVRFSPLNEYDKWDWHSPNKEAEQYAKLFVEAINNTND